MRLPYEILGEFVNELRLRRSKGAGASELVRYLYENHVWGILAARHLDEAFFAFFHALRFVLLESETPDDSNVAFAFDLAFAHASDAWRSAPPYPDLLSRRDREAFRAVARGRECHLLVEAVDPHARAHRGAPGVRPWPAGPVAVSRRSEPNAGLMAADPADLELQVLLAAESPPRSYAEYVAELAADGFTVSGPEENYVIRDGQGQRYHPGYHVLGMYEPETGADVWRAPEGEAIRRELNERMGGELVAQGPHGSWRFRDAPVAGPRRGPRAPVLWFDWAPNGNVHALQDVQALYEEHLSNRIPWPYHEVEP